MTTWRQGVDAVRSSLARSAERPEKFLAMLARGEVPRVPGTAVFLTRANQAIPSLIGDHIKHMGALHRHVIALTVVFEETPRIAEEDRSRVEPVGEGIVRVQVCFGFIEIPDLQLALVAVKGLDPGIDLANAVFFGTRDQVVPKPGSPLFSHWRLPLFAFLYRNAVKIVDRFNLPPANVVEIARQIEI